MTLFPDSAMPEYGIPTSGDAMQHVAEIRHRIAAAYFTDPTEIALLLSDEDPVTRLSAKHELQDAQSELIADREMRCENFSRFIAEIPRLFAN